MSNPDVEIVDEFRNKNGDTIVLAKKEYYSPDYEEWSVECYDRSDISKWAASFRYEDDARRVFKNETERKTG